MVAVRGDMRLGQREVDIVLAVDAVQLDLRRAGVGEGEGVVILAGKNSGAFAAAAAEFAAGGLAGLVAPTAPATG